MKNIFFIVFTFFSLFAFSSNSKKIIVALSLNDCANFSIVLRHLDDVLSNPEFTFIFQKNLEQDSILVNKRTGVYDFKSSIVKYSDSLYRSFSSGIHSTINIQDNNELIYSSTLLDLNVDEFLNIYLDTNENICYNNLKSGVQYIQDDLSLLIYNPQLYRWSYYDQNNSFDIIADNDWVKSAYKIYYKSEDIEENYKDYETLVKELPNINPSINNAKKINENEILFLVDVKIIEKDYIKQNKNIVKKYFFFKYNMKEKTITSIKYINTDHELLNHKYRIVNSSAFHIIENSYIIPLNTSNGDPAIESKYLSVFEENKNNPNQLILKEIINKNIPNNYIKYKMNNGFHSYCFDKSLIFLKYGEFIYDYKKDVQYKIPFPESEISGLSNILDTFKTGKISTYYVLDISDNDQTILVLYKDSLKNLKLMEIDKKTEKSLKDTILLSSIELEVYKNNSSFSFNEKGQVHFLYNNNCVTKL